MDAFDDLWYDCEDCDSLTSEDQCDCEKECSRYLTSFSIYTKEQIENFREGGLLNESNEIRLLRRLHCQYLTNGLSQLSAGFITLDSSRPWIVYWIIHALYLLENEPLLLFPRIIKTLFSMQNTTGGYGGGPQQLSHAAPNYAAVLALCTIGSPEAYESINRKAMYSFFMSLKHASGGFRMHHDGEIDSRGTYTVLAVARVLNILTEELKAGVKEYLLSCQTYEGGFGGEPGNEAHGGYNFCALAALVILGEGHRCRLDAQENWLIRRQMRLEGGFQGRTNKLVDSCYSFWQGASMALVHLIKTTQMMNITADIDLYDMNLYLSYCHPTTSTTATTTSSSGNNNSGSSSISVGTVDNVDVDVDVDLISLENRIDSLNDTNNSENNVLIDTKTVTNNTSEIQDKSNVLGSLLYNQKALQRYILHCGQQLECGGLRDKPGKSRDYYHSCYALSGLSVSQWHNYEFIPHDFKTDTSVDTSVNAISTDSSSISGSDDNKYTSSPTGRVIYTPPKVYGDIGNLIKPTSAVYNIGYEKLHLAITYFQQLPCISTS